MKPTCPLFILVKYSGQGTPNNLLYGLDWPATYVVDMLQVQQHQTSIFEPTYFLHQNFSL